MNLLETIVVEVVCVMEKHVIFRTQFHPDLIGVTVFTEDEDFDLDGFESANLLRACVAVLNSQLEGDLSIIDDSMTVG